MARRNYVVFLYILLGMVIYAIAILATFGPSVWQRSTLGPTMGPAVMITAASVEGLGVVLVGYVMIVVLGGSMSLALTRTIARMTRSKQIVELTKTSAISSERPDMLGLVHWLYVPGLVFISAVGLGWDVHNADGPGAGFFQPVLRILDVFSKPPSGVGPVLFSRQLIPGLVILTVIAGLCLRL